MVRVLPLMAVLVLVALAAPTSASGYGSVCLLPKDPGPCEALISRYYYNQYSGRCEHFYYGGCEGNANNFESKQECQTACVPSYG